MTNPGVTRKVWVESVKKLYTYVPVTIGEPADIGMAYDVTMKPMDSRPLINDDGVDLEVVADMVELDDIRAELGLYRPNLLKAAVNALWRKTHLDNAHLSRSPGNWREYRVGHSKHKG